MQIRAVKTIILVVVLLFGNIDDTIQGSEKGQKPEYQKRRQALLQLMPDSSIAVFLAAAPKVRSNDVTYKYRQENNLYYLTGIDEGEIALLLSSSDSLDGSQSDEILFIPDYDERKSVWDGPQIDAEIARRRYGFSNVQSLSAFHEVIAKHLDENSKLYYLPEMNYFHEPLSDRRYFMERDMRNWVEDAFPGIAVESPAEMLQTLRLIKSPMEMKYLQKAIDITCAALSAAMVRLKPGLFEYQVQATIEFVFTDMGSDYPAFPCIIGSGPNSTILHYGANRRQMVDRDLLLMDIGAEYRGYSADVTRTVPVNGVFSPAQRELYNIVLRAQKAAIAAVKPGVTIKDVHAVAKGIIEEAGYGPYFMHGTSHFLGLDTHDVGDRSETLQPGMVLTVEPGIYIRENAEVNRKYWNIGIRIEDDVLVTEDGAKELSQSAPREIAEIETLMRTN